MLNEVTPAITSRLERAALLFTAGMFSVSMAMVVIRHLGPTLPMEEARVVHPIRPTAADWCQRTAALTKVRQAALVVAQGQTMRQVIRWLRVVPA